MACQYQRKYDLVRFESHNGVVEIRRDLKTGVVTGCFHTYCHVGAEHRCHETGPLESDPEMTRELLKLTEVACGSGSDAVKFALQLWDVAYHLRNS